MDSKSWGNSRCWEGDGALQQEARGEMAICYWGRMMDKELALIVQGSGN